MQADARLSNRQKITYALGDLSSNILFSATSFYLLYFIINVGGLSPFYASAIFLLNKFSDGLTDYFMGVICDHTTLHHGRRRMYMLWGAIPFGLFFSLLWVVPDTSVQVYKFIYYLAIYSIHDTIWTIVYIPYNSLMANITDDYDERTSLNGWRVLIANLGLVLGAAVFPLFADGPESIFYRVFGSERAAYYYASLLFGIISGALMLTCALTVKERPQMSPSTRVTPLKTLKEFFSMKEFRNTLLYYLLAMSSIDVVMSVFVFYLSDSLAITNGVYVSIFLALPLIGSSMSALFWVKLSERYSRHRIYVAAIMGAVLLLFTTPFIPQKGYLAVGAFCITVGFFMSAIQVLPFASIPDVVEVDEYYHGVRREGSYFGVVQFSYNVAGGLALSLVSLLLGLFGYVEDSVGLLPEDFIQPAAALTAIRWTFALLPALLLAGSALFSHRANMDRVRFNALKAEIAQRKEPV